MQRVKGKLPADIPRAVKSSLSLDEYWDEKLNKKYALAPRILQIMGTIDDNLYLQHNTDFNNLVSRYVSKELTCMAAEKAALGQNLIGSTITVYGPGLGRGLGFAKRALREMKMKTKFFDISRHALKMTNMELRRIETYHEGSSILREITGTDDDIPSSTKLVLMSQFLQILPNADYMSSIMRMIARHTKKHPDTRTVIVHPFDNDNENAGWGDTTPYTLEELLAPTEDVLGHPLTPIREQGFVYFGIHNYKAITLALT